MRVFLGSAGAGVGVGVAAAVAGGVVGVAGAAVVGADGAGFAVAGAGLADGVVLACGGAAFFSPHEARETGSAMARAQRRDREKDMRGAMRWMNGARKIMLQLGGPSCWQSEKSS